MTKNEARKAIDALNLSSPQAASARRSISRATSSEAIDVVIMANVETTTDRETLRQIVRGDRPLSDLSALGMTMNLADNRCSVDNPRKISAPVDIHDVAKGLVVNLANPDRLREWAMFVNVADVDFDFENHPQGETVLAALWDASFRNPIAPSVVEVLENLSRNGSEA